MEGQRLWGATGVQRALIGGDRRQPGEVRGSRVRLFVPTIQAAAGFGAPGGVVAWDLGTPRAPGACRNRRATVDLRGVQTRLDPIRRDGFMWRRSIDLDARAVTSMRRKSSAC